MERSKIHELLDAALDIIQSGEGEDGHPYVSVDIKNYGSKCIVYIFDKGFDKNMEYDGCYFIDESTKGRYTACMEHLARLKKEAANGRQA